MVLQLPSYADHLYLFLNPINWSHRACDSLEEIAALTIRASAEQGVVHRAAPARIGS